MKSILKILASFLGLYRRFKLKYIYRPIFKSCLGYCGKNVDLRLDRNPGALSRVYMYDNTNIYHGFRFVSVTGKFIMMKNSGSAAGLTVITGNHQRQLGVFLKDITGSHDNDIEKDIIVEDDVWLGANVTLLSGAYIGRGAIIGAGSVVRTKVPPYSIVTGNPAKVMGFSFTPKEILEHEALLYPESERLSEELLEKNYQRYYKRRLKSIAEYQKL